MARVISKYDLIALPVVDAERRLLKVVDETHEISRRRGNGKLRREIWADAGGEVVRFNLTFINREIHRGDNGRVLVRYSGTQNMCRAMVEGPTQELTEKYCKQIADVIKNTIG